MQNRKTINMLIALNSYRHASYDLGEIRRRLISSRTSTLRKTSLEQIEIEMVKKMEKISNGYPLKNFRKILTAIGYEFSLSETTIFKIGDKDFSVSIEVYLTHFSLRNKIIDKRLAKLVYQFFGEKNAMLHPNFNELEKFKSRLEKYHQIESMTNKESGFSCFVKCRQSRVYVLHVHASLEYVFNIEKKIDVVEAELMLSGEDACDYDRLKRSLEVLNV